MGKVSRETAEDAVKNILRYIGEDPDREGLVDTPRRYLDYLVEICSRKKFTFTTFESEDYDQVIVQKHIPFYSMCEHHMAPFFGTAAVAYIPGKSKRIVGLSKLARAVQSAAAGLQNQERVTHGTLRMIVEAVEPLGAAVVITARHLCMETRGARVHDTETTTSALNGVFIDEPETRRELFSLINNSS